MIKHSITCKVMYKLMGSQEAEINPPPTASASLAPNLDRNRLIVRQNALTNAVNFSSGKGENVTVEQVIKVARAFEAFTSGDADEKESEKDSEEPNWQEAAGKLRAAS